jgi:hypothetical protein
MERSHIVLGEGTGKGSAEAEESDRSEEGGKGCGEVVGCRVVSEGASCGRHRRQIRGFGEWK